MHVLRPARLSRVPNPRGKRRSWFVSTTAHGSRSLRTRQAGGRRPRVVWTRSTRVPTRAGSDVACPRRGNPSHRRGCPGFPVASAGVAKLTGPVVSSRTKPHHSSVRSDLIPPDRSASVRRRCDGEPGTQATTSNDRQQTARPPLPGARPLAAQAPPEALPLTFRHPPHPAAGRPPDACAVTRTRARSCTRTPAGRQRVPQARHQTAPPSGSYLKPCEAVKSS